MNLEVTPKDDVFDRIEAYYLHKGKLSDKDMEVCERWERAFSMLCEHRIRKVALDRFIDSYKAQGQPISLATAYRDFAAAERLFTPMRKYSKEFLRLVTIESAMRDVLAAEEKMQALEANDLRAFALLQEVKDRAERRIISAAGLKKDDPNIIDFSKLEPSTFLIQAPDDILKMYKNITSKGVVNITDLFNAMSEEAQLVIDSDIDLDDEDDEDDD